ncbi:MULTISPECIES: hypothetical protein [unclassified Legionella]|uniref:hypothetical protein n=1 Tax=unclassified Legionella TaxID=2622702 RepID=UPI0010566CCB|nr:MULTISPECIES: hypothetical protein [unclassified Legionella]MDI9817782.1 hypothetical protein [Legionella sp. PL877]
MRSLNELLLKQIKTSKKIKKEKETFGYYPDVFIFLHDQTQYSEELKRLSRAKYLYTDGYDLKPVGFLSYAFQSFKGWLGFNNHCQRQKVALGLYKFAYYGYLNNYQRDELGNLQHHGLTEEDITLFQGPKNDKTTEKIQEKLIGFYVEHSKQFSVSLNQVQVTKFYIFGSAWERIGFWEEIPKLDPQRQQLINDTVNHLETGEEKKHYVHFADSQYARAAAAKIVDEVIKEEDSIGSQVKNKWNRALLTKKSPGLLERAISFAPSISSKKPELFIRYYFQQKKFKQAWPLIESLVDTNVDTNKEAALGYLTDIPREHIEQLITKDSELATVLASHYFKTKPDDIETIRFVSQFTTLNDQFPRQAFRLLVDKKDFDNAYKLLEQQLEKAHSNRKQLLQFNTKDLGLLANHFERLGNSHADAAVREKRQGNWEHAISFALKSVEAKNKAMQIDPNRKEQFYTQKRFYAELLIDSDISQNPDAPNCQIDIITKAITLLEQCSPLASQEKKKHQLALAKARVRRVDYLAYQISPTDIVHRFPQDFSKHKKDNIKNLASIMAYLQQIVEQLNGTSEPELKQILGKAYFLLDDIAMFFGLNHNYGSNFKKAMETVPENPFYILRCSECFEKEKDKLQHQALPKLNALGFDALNYYHWDKQRWLRDKIEAATPIKDIHNLHNPQPKSTSLVNRLASVVGFNT